MERKCPGTFKCDIKSVQRHYNGEECRKGENSVMSGPSDYLTSCI